jgi:P27 family predicted phage terminase small subunit
MTGRPPKPTALKRLTGTDRGGGDGPQPSNDIPKPPDHLNPIARREWRRLVKQLHPLGLLTNIDGDQLALYCVAYSRWCAAEVELAKSGVVVTSPNGYPIQNPHLAIATKAMEQMYRYLGKFGMNPVDRARIHVTPAQQEDAIEREFFGHESLKIG